MEMNMDMSLNGIAGRGPAPDPTPSADLPVAGAPRRARKILFYSAELAGGAQLDRLLRRVETLKDALPEAEILVLSSASQTRRFALPAGVDHIRLPSLEGIDPARFEAGPLSLGVSAIDRSRRAILEVSISGFAPDLVIVDGRLVEPDAALVAAIAQLRRARPAARVVLGIGDVPDPVEMDRDLGSRERDLEAVERLFDEVWISGSEEICDRVRESGFSRAMAARSHFCGYPLRPAPSFARSNGAPRVVLAAGAETPGTELIEVFLEGLAGLTYKLAIATTVILGPQVPDERRRELRIRFGSHPGVEFHDSDAPLEHHYAQADVVLTTPDYDPVCEILSFGIPALLVPGAAPTRAQRLRARRLADFDLFEVVEPDSVKPYSLIAKALDRLEAGTRPKQPAEYLGTERLLDRTRALLESVEAPRLAR